jgi:formate-dependent nitrite reductase membrane component NrfD
MYITNTQNIDNQIKCPTVCEQPLHIYINLLATVFGIACLAIYFIKKKFFLHPRSKKKKIIVQILSIVFWFFLAFFALFFLQLSYQHVEKACSAKDILLSGNIVPDIWRPLYTTR